MNRPIENEATEQTACIKFLTSASVRTVLSRRHRDHFIGREVASKWKYFQPRTPLMKPRTECDCQPVALMSSFRGGAPGRFTRSTTLTVLLPLRASGFSAFLGLCAFSCSRATSQGNTDWSTLEGEHPLRTKSIFCNLSCQPFRIADHAVSRISSICTITFILPSPLLTPSPRLA